MLSKEQLERYQADGYIVVEDLIPASTLQTLREKIAALTEEASAGRGLPSFAQTEAGTATEKAPLRKLNELCRSIRFSNRSHPVLHCWILQHN